MATFNVTPTRAKIVSHLVNVLNRFRGQWKFIMYITGLINLQAIHSKGTSITEVASVYQVQY